MVRVRAYRKRDGTFVRSHWRNMDIQLARAKQSIEQIRKRLRKTKDEQYARHSWEFMNAKNYLEASENIAKGRRLPWGMKKIKKW